MNAAYLVVFTLNDRRYALWLSAVEQVVHMVDITPLPEAPPVVLGVVNIRGRILPVVDIRQRFHLPQRELRLTDHLILAHTEQRPLAIPVDAVTEVMMCPDERMIRADQILPGKLAYMEGVVKLEDGLIFIHDLDTFLSLEEAQRLDRALKKAPEA